MSNLDNKNKNLLVENIIVFFLFTVFLVFNSLKTLSKIFTYGIIKKEILTTKSNLGVDIKIIEPNSTMGKILKRYEVIIKAISISNAWHALYLTK